MEIERKFLVKKLPEELERFPHSHISQAYLSRDPVLRVRQRDAQYLLTCKGQGLLKREWLDYPIVDRAGIEATLEEFKDSYAVGGIDLSQTTDLTAASIIIERNGVLYGFCRFFMPANRLEVAQAIDGVPYDIFVKKGILQLSGENHVDYRDVYNWFVDLRDNFGIYILKIGYDRYSAQYLIDDLKAAGFQVDDVWQGENLAPVIREFEGIIKDGNFKIVDNNLLKAHFLNVALKHNMETRKFRPVKIEQRSRIDGFVSVIDAMTVRQKYFAEIGEMLQNVG